MSNDDEIPDAWVSDWLREGPDWAQHKLGDAVWGGTNPNNPPKMLVMGNPSVDRVRVLPDGTEMLFIFNQNIGPDLGPIKISLGFRQQAVITTMGPEFRAWVESIDEDDIHKPVMCVFILPDEIDFDTEAFFKETENTEAPVENVPTSTPDKPVSLSPKDLLARVIEEVERTGKTTMMHGSEVEHTHEVNQPHHSGSEVYPDAPHITFMGRNPSRAQLLTIPEGAAIVVTDWGNGKAEGGWWSGDDDEDLDRIAGLTDYSITYFTSPSRDSE